MAESAEDVYARVVAAVGADGHLPMPPQGGWDIFPWTVVDGEVAPRTLAPPSDEDPRWGEHEDKPCGPCAGVPTENIVWQDETWVLKHLGGPSGLPVVLILEPREHVDFGRLDDDMASEHGRITNRLVRIVESLPHIGRCHVMRYGDGSEHAHTWVVGRTARLTHVLGSPTIEWDEIIPPGPEEVWREDLHTIAHKLANWGGEALA
jgi:diadenosine tetraphosphate (Ap4A) HIT family hydrolase